MNALVRSYGPKGLRCLAIYIAEAHAKDQWPVGKTISCVDQPTTIEQRLDNARQCQEKFCFDIPMLVDSMENTFHLTYGAWPFRFYIIHQGQLIVKAEPNTELFHYDLDEIDGALKKFYS